MNTTKSVTPTNESSDVKYQRPVIRKVALESKKSILGTCKVANAGTRGLGPCGSDLAAVCK
jgi:hypothetical protein